MQRPFSIEKQDTFRQVSILGGLCFFLSALEFMIPKPLPFMRLGLANLPLLLSLDILPLSSFILLVVLKIMGQALISGTLFSYIFLFSLGGTGASAIIMYLLRRIFGREKISFIGISTAGALAFNGTQLVLAYFFIFGKSTKYAAAPILALGTVTGILLGMAAEYFIARSDWYALFKVHMHAAPGPRRLPRQNDTAETNPANINPADVTVNRPLERFRKKRERLCLGTFGSAELALTGLCMMPALLLNPDVKTRVIQFLFFSFLAWLSGKRNNPLITITVMLGIVLFNLLVPFGQILFTIGPVKITSGALQGGIRRAVTLEGLFMLSRCFVRKDLAFPGFFGNLIGDSFRVFSHLDEEKFLFNRKNWVEQLDRILVMLPAGSGSFKGPGHGFPEAEKEDKRYGRAKTGQFTLNFLIPKLILFIAVVLAWLPLAVL